jgi:hypothetical protein
MNENKGRKPMALNFTNIELFTMSTARLTDRGDR